MFGDVERDIIERCQKNNTKLPEAVANAPKLDFGNQWYFDVWQELSNDRQIGFGCGPIPSSSIRDYGIAEQLTSIEIEDLRYLLRELDIEYLQYQEKKAKDKEK